MHHLLTAEGEQLPGETRRAPGRLDDLAEVLAVPVRDGGICGHELREPENDRQQIVEIVGDARRQLPDSVHFVRLPDLRLERVSWRDNETGTVTTHEIRHIFSMTGAVPSTSWLERCVTLDGEGFIKTGPDLSKEDLAAAHWPLARPPHLLETSLPGVFAVGDVRCGNVKRVASAVGEGSIAITFVHDVLHE